MDFSIMRMKLRVVILSQKPVPFDKAEAFLYESVLYDAVNKLDYQLVKTLIHQGVNINFMHYSDSTPLHLAVRKGDAAMIELLLKHGADPSQTDIYRNTPVDIMPDDREDIEEIFKNKTVSDLWEFEEGNQNYSGNPHGFHYTEPEPTSYIQWLPKEKLDDTLALPRATKTA